MPAPGADACEPRVLGRRLVDESEDEEEEEDAGPDLDSDGMAAESF
jgi:hypothetical protein